MELWCVNLSKNTIEVRPRTIVGYILLGGAVVLFVYITILSIFLANGTFQPLKVALANPVNGNDVIIGIVLQLGVYAILAGIAFGLGKLGVDLTKNSN
jgi:hypothetical protein